MRRTTRIGFEQIKLCEQYTAKRLTVSRFPRVISAVRGMPTIAHILPEARASDASLVGSHGSKRDVPMYQSRYSQLENQASLFGFWCKRYSQNASSSRCVTLQGVDNAS